MSENKKDEIILRNEGEEVRINFDELRAAVLVFRAINHDLRKQIIGLLENTPEMTVTDIYVALRVEQSIASQHLGILRKAGVVKTRRDGKFIYYSIQTERMAYLAGVIETLSN
ncbi:helix-turn-helix transcriptional regulator [Lewinella sp. 4G2]|uniref:ArsR/SmtB family transcription factor n=1 Tax=Lewinella sp. 4G2 TaxID=1803372 RepID=UPI0007B4C32C|nr:metalloregulator ArsR/SmtB family transcription factor [Lewinella sp. 4G2]OAV43100.1 transcriptional regulator [Lewinella sp. 4G2]